MQTRYEQTSRVSKEQAIKELYELRQLRQIEEQRRQMSDSEKQRIQYLEHQYPRYKGKSVSEINDQMLDDFPPNYNRAPPVVPYRQQLQKDICELYQLKEHLFGNNGAIIIGNKYDAMVARVEHLEKMYPKYADLDSNQLRDAVFRLAAYKPNVQEQQNQAQATVHSQNMHQIKSDYMLQYNRAPKPVAGTTGLRLDFPNKEERSKFLLEQAAKGRDFIATDDNNKVMAYAKDGVLYHANHEEFKVGDSLKASNITKEEFREAFANANQNTGPGFR